MNVLKPSTLTVRVVKRKLGDHYLDFLNFHNPKGFEPEEDAEIRNDTVGGFLVHIAMCDAMTMDELRRAVTQLRNRLPRHVGIGEHAFHTFHSNANAYIAKAFGYRDWVMLSNAPLVDGKVPNKLARGSAGASIFSTDVLHHLNCLTWQEGDPLPPNFPLLRLSERYDRRFKAFLAYLEEGTPEAQALKEQHRSRMLLTCRCTLAKVYVDGKMMVLSRGYLYWIDHKLKEINKARRQTPED